MSRALPVNVARQLRQEAGFGCAVCGCPIIEYHHIIPWAERQHFEPEHMVVLCPTHHRELGKLPRRLCYEAKKAPRNIRENRLEGLLGGNNNAKGIKFGSTTFEEGYPLVYAFQHPIISYHRIDGQYLINLFVPDRNFWPEIEIRSNQISSRPSLFWAIIYLTNP